MIKSLWVRMPVWLLVIGLWSGVAFAQENVTKIIKKGAAEQIQSTFSNGLSIGYIKVGTTDVGSISWRPDLKFGPWGLGLDVNIPFSGGRPSGYENLVARYVEYDDGAKGLRYGVLENVTLGHGLLMRNYTTRLSGAVFLNSAQIGLKGYYKFDQYGVEAMRTGSNIYTVRVTEQIHPLLILGQYAVTDRDGVDVVQSDGTSRHFVGVTGVGIDASTPLPYNFEGYAELAAINNKGKGFSAGVSWGFDFLIASASMLAEYRLIDANFIPGYFNADYESNPTDITAYEANTSVKNGVLAELKAQALGLSNLSLVYESYENGNPSLMGTLNAKVSDQITVAGYYKQPQFTDFKSLTLEEGAVIGADIAYKANPFTATIIHYKKAYNACTGQVEESQSYEVQFSF